MQRYTVYLETALHVSGGTSTHHQESIKLYLHHLVFVRPLQKRKRYAEQKKEYTEQKTEYTEHKKVYT
jgi:hypothetical protein